MPTKRSSRESLRSLDASSLSNTSLVRHLEVEIKIPLPSSLSTKQHLCRAPILLLATNVSHHLFTNLDLPLPLLALNQSFSLWLSTPSSFIPLCLNVPLPIYYLFTHTHTHTHNDTTQFLHNHNHQLLTTVIKTNSQFSTLPAPSFAFRLLLCAFRGRT